jgi:hypothetical protein
LNFDKYCSLEFIDYLCSRSHFLLLPYTRTGLSSGLLGYASQYRIPVIATGKGLLGRLVRKFNLGILIKDSTPQDLLIAYEKVPGFLKICHFDDYLKENSVERFSSTLLK